jgi:hypothetical protein
MDQPKTALIDLHYLPSIEYFVCLQQYDQVILEAHEHYEKQTYRNRCHILTANKVAALSVPVIGGNKKVPFKELKIDYQQKWVNNHWRAIASAYGKSPFFEYYQDYFKAAYDKKVRYLIDLNLEFLSLCLNFLQVNINWQLSERYEANPAPWVDDLRSHIHPKSSFEAREFYTPYSYPQLFGKNFVANLSIVDLLFCEGSGAAYTLQQSTLRKNKTNQLL